MKTLSSPILVPPPPVPPGRAAAAGADSEGEPRRTSHGCISVVTRVAHQPHQTKSVRPISFAEQVLAELRHVVWPSRSEVCAASVVTMGLLGFFALYVQGLNMAAYLLTGGLGLR